MPKFPMFIDLRGKKCVVIGGGEVASRKVGVLLDFGADIILVSPELDDRIKAFCENGRIKILQKEYEIDDIEGAFLAIAATSSKDLNETIYRDSVKKNVFVNVVDNPENCTFTFPSVVKRDKLVIGITTSGRFPAMSRQIRELIEYCIPEDYGKVLKLLGDARDRVKKNIKTQGKRREVIDRIQEFVLKNFNLFSDEKLTIEIDKIIGEYEDEAGN